MKKDQVFIFYMALIILGGSLGYKKSPGNEIIGGLKGATIGVVTSLILFKIFEKKIY